MGCILRRSTSLWGNIGQDFCSHFQDCSVEGNVIYLRGRSSDLAYYTLRKLLCRMYRQLPSLLERKCHCVRNHFRLDQLGIFFHSPSTLDGILHPLDSSFLFDLRYEKIYELMGIQILKVYSKAVMYLNTWAIRIMWSNEFAKTFLITIFSSF